MAPSINNTLSSMDWQEKASKVCLYLPRIALYPKYTTNPTNPEATRIHIIALRIFAGIVAFTVLLPITFAGVILLRCSKTYSKRFSQAIHQTESTAFQPQRAQSNTNNQVHRQDSVQARMQPSPDTDSTTLQPERTSVTTLKKEQNHARQINLIQTSVQARTQPSRTDTLQNSQLVSVPVQKQPVVALQSRRQAIEEYAKTKNLQPEDIQDILTVFKILEDPVMPEAEKIQRLDPCLHFGKMDQNFDKFRQAVVSFCEEQHVPILLKVLMNDSLLWGFFEYFLTSKENIARAYCSAYWDYRAKNEMQNKYLFHNFRFTDENHRHFEIAWETLLEADFPNWNQPLKRSLMSELMTNCMTVNLAHLSRNEERVFGQLADDNIRKVFDKRKVRQLQQEQAHVEVLTPYITNSNLSKIIVEYAGIRDCHLISQWDEHMKSEIERYRVLYQNRTTSDAIQKFIDGVFSDLTTYEKDPIHVRQLQETLCAYAYVLLEQKEFGKYGHLFKRDSHSTIQGIVGPFLMQTLLNQQANQPLTQDFFDQFDLLNKWTYYKPDSENPDRLISIAYGEYMGLIHGFAARRLTEGPQSKSRPLLFAYAILMTHSLRMEEFWSNLKNYCTPEERCEFARITAQFCKKENISTVLYIMALDDKPMDTFMFGTMATAFMDAIVKREKDIVLETFAVYWRIFQRFKNYSPNLSSLTTQDLFWKACVTLEYYDTSQESKDACYDILEKNTCKDWRGDDHAHPPGIPLSEPVRKQLVQQWKETWKKHMAASNQQNNNSQAAKN